MKLVPKQPWAEHANCRGKDPDLFFPPLDISPSGYRRRRVYSWDGAAARAVCRGCPVMTECREYAFATRQREGVWGALVFVPPSTAGKRRLRSFERVA